MEAFIEEITLPSLDDTAVARGGAPGAVFSAATACNELNETNVMEKTTAK